MKKKLSHISPKDYAALLEKVSGLELALTALAADNETLISHNEALTENNAQLAQKLERERCARDEAVRKAVEKAVGAVRAELEAIIKSQEAENARLVEQFKLLQQAFFGSKSERIHPDQLSLFNDVEASADSMGEPLVQDSAPAQKTRRRGGPRKVDLSKLECVVVEHDLAQEERACPQCGSEMVELRVEVTEKLRMVPAHLVVELHRTHIYICKPCSNENAEGKDVSSTIVRAPRPREAFPKSLATPSLVSWVLEQKYAMSLPLYRLETQMRALGVELSRQDMCNWVMLAWERWLVWIRNRIRAYILSRQVIHADETPVQVLREPGRKAQSKSYCWVFCTCASDHPAYNYVYAPTRARDVVAAELSGWTGALVSDGYAPYFSLEGITNIACLAHIRRRFALLVKSCGGDEVAAGSSGDLPLALDGRRLVDRIFHAEHAIGDVSLKEREQLRQGDVARAMGEFESWCHAMLPFATPGLKLQQALKYAISYMPYVRNALLCGGAELTNNRAERAVKPFVLGRKNWLFSNTARGAEASCGIYSIVTTARECGLSPMRYIEWLLEELPKVANLDKPEVIDRYLPWSDLIPKSVRATHDETSELRDIQEEPIADVDPGKLREDE